MTIRFDHYDPNEFLSTFIAFIMDSFLLYKKFRQNQACHHKTCKNPRKTSRCTHGWMVSR